MTCFGFCARVQAFPVIVISLCFFSLFFQSLSLLGTQTITFTHVLHHFKIRCWRMVSLHSTKQSDLNCSCASSSCSQKQHVPQRQQVLSQKLLNCERKINPPARFLCSRWIHCTHSIAFHSEFDVKPVFCYWSFRACPISNKCCTQYTWIDCSYYVLKVQATWWSAQSKLSAKQMHKQKVIYDL